MASNKTPKVKVNKKIDKVRKIIYEFQIIKTAIIPMLIGLVTFIAISGIFGAIVNIIAPAGDDDQEQTNIKKQFYSEEVSNNEKEIIMTSDVATFALQFIGDTHERFTSYTIPEGIKTFYKVAPSTKGDWCAMFASYCYYQCGLIPEVLPHPYRGCVEYTYIKEQTTRWRYKSDGYIPSSGDLIFFKKSSEQTPYHTGIVTSCDGTTVYTVEGNTGQSNTDPYWKGSHVMAREYKINYANIFGYFSLNNN